MFSIVLFSLLVLIALLFVFTPVAAGWRRERAEVERERLLAEKATSLQLLRELEFDRRTGKLTEEDYETAYAEVELTTIAVLRRLDELGAVDPWTPEGLEAEIARVRDKLAKGEGRA